MHYKKLGVLAIIAASMPAIGYFLNRYQYISTFPYGAFYHSTWSFGNYTFQLLLFIGVLGVCLGLIRPQLSLWFGEKNRKRVFVVYGLIIAVAFGVRYEAYEFSKVVFAREEQTMNEAYAELRPGSSAKELEATIKSIDPNIRYAYIDTSSFKRIDGYPNYVSTKYVVEFAYPGFFPKYDVQSRIVAEMSSDPHLPEARAEQIFLLDRFAVKSRK
jgi:hypothetical protein